MIDQTKKAKNRESYLIKGKYFIKIGKVKKTFKVK